VEGLDKGLVEQANFARTDSTRAGPSDRCHLPITNQLALTLLDDGQLFFHSELVGWLAQVGFFSPLPGKRRDFSKTSVFLNETDFFLAPKQSCKT
jgi:hypothetical protein